MLLATDGGFTLDIGQYDPSLPAPYMSGSQPNAFDVYFASAISLWHGHGDSQCAAAAHTLQDRIDCYNTSLVLQKGLIPLPSFVAESPLDIAQITDDLCPRLYGYCQVPHDPHSMEGVYATAFGSDIASTLVGAGTSAAYAVYGPNPYLHVLLTGGTVFTTQYSFPAGPLSGTRRVRRLAAESGQRTHRRYWRRGRCSPSTPGAAPGVSPQADTCLWPQLAG